MAKSIGHASAEGICGDPMRHLYQLVQSGADETAVMNALLAEADTVRERFIQRLQPELKLLMEQQAQCGGARSNVLRTPDPTFSIPSNRELSSKQAQILREWCVAKRDWLKKLDSGICLALYACSKKDSHRLSGLEIAECRDGAMQLITAEQGAKPAKMKALKLPDAVASALREVKTTEEERRIVEYMLLKRATIGGKEGEKVRPIEVALFQSGAVFNMNEGSVAADSISAKLEGLGGDIRIDRPTLFQTTSINPATPGRQGNKVLCYKLHYPETES